MVWSGGPQLRGTAAAKLLRKVNPLLLLLLLLLLPSSLLLLPMVLALLLLLLKTRLLLLQAGPGGCQLKQQELSLWSREQQLL